jgi:hypothetical protein
MRSLNPRVLWLSFAEKSFLMVFTMKKYKGLERSRRHQSTDFFSLFRIGGPRKTDDRTIGASQHNLQ